MLRVAAVVCVSILLTSLAGCLTERGDIKGFDAIAAPEWAPGYQWTYAASEGMGGGFGGQMHSEDKSLTLGVFNTTHPLAGTAVYYVRATETLENPLFGSPLLALRQADLGLAGRGTEHDEYRAMPVPIRTYPGGDFGESYVDPCAGRGVIDEASEDESIPAPLFPLVDGKSTRGVTSFGEGGPGLQWVLRTHGLRSVDVPAGRLDAALVTLDMTPAVALPGLGGSDGPGLKIHAEYYYAPAVRYFAKIVLSAAATGFDGPEAFTYESVMDLTSFSLGPRDASPAPVTRQAPTEGPRLRIISDQSFPLNVAEETSPVTFGLAPGYDSYDLGEPELDAAAITPIDASQYDVFWTLRNGDQQLQGKGLTFQTTLDHPGGYSVAANILPRVCGIPWNSGAYAFAPTTWSRTWTRHIDPGLSDVIELGPVPTENSIPFTATATWKIIRPGSPTPATLTDGSGPRFVDESGAVFAPQAQSGQSATFELPPKALQVAWLRQGPAGALGNLPVGVGGDLTLTVTLDLPYWTTTSYP